MRHNESDFNSPQGWHPGLLREIVLATASKLSHHGIPLPPLDFYEAVADRGEEIIIEAIAEAIAASHDDTDTVIANIRVARRFLERFGDDLFLATEETDDPLLARLAAYLALEGSDGYNEIRYQCAWGAQGSPDWGTLWGVKQKIRDFTPAFVLKVCMKGDFRWLGVECHAPNRVLPEDINTRVRARTMIVSGIPVLAFSPADVEKDASACVEEIGCALSVLAQELLAMHGLESRPRLDFRPRGERSLDD
ncbi:hypothetical protein [Bradyrhizobium japonicum]|uniref:hypothetical protein n=1 Tax=Bradyrhizobium japonicum TaxID=375 RepID=UPI001E63DD20|nr:hypothetical protein [Bradyrhizobium japonicum]MCD9824578.1 hypothetical protein [Bradyrhizobium japonicum]MCD9897413.1 hypothetical protein [Bradyrhizobium japonicum]MEB2671155.1 hypothetical protein [Bradyrhizobium japonicum]WLB28605.1 hypothetical protein QIH85_43700 [Bradyrhizobium japonicum]WRI90479.1 hypothetical protein R3F75_05860 [Bradyrhizobium japonicum]